MMEIEKIVTEMACEPVTSNTGYQKLADCLNDGYTPEEYLKAAEIGEVSMIDAKHVVSLLDEAREVLSKGFDCWKCKNSFSNPMDELFCELDYDLEKDEDCGGEHFEKRK
jgi:hypothetical protein